MCVPFLGAALGAAASIAGGVAQAQMAKYQERVAKINAEAAVREGFAQAGATRDQFAEVKGAQTAALAKSGVDINSGTSAVLGLETQRREEVASAVDIWKGRSEQTAYLNQAKAAKAEGRAAMLGGILGGVTSLVGGLSGLGQGKPLAFGKAAPAPTGVSSTAAPRTGTIPVSPYDYRPRRVFLAGRPAGTY